MYGREALAHREAAELLREVQAILDKADEDALRVVDHMITDKKTASVVAFAQYQAGRIALQDAAAWQRQAAQGNHNARGVFGGLFGSLVG